MISLCSVAQRAIQRRSLDEIAEGQVRRGQIRRRSLDEVCWLNPAGCLAGPVYIHPGIQGGPCQIGVLHSDWSRIWGDCECCGRKKVRGCSTGVLLTDLLIPGRFPGCGKFSLAVDLGRVAVLDPGQAEFLLAGDPSWVAEPAMRDAEFSLAKSPGCFPLR